MPQTKIISQKLKLFSTQSFKIPKNEELRSEYVEYAKEIFKIPKNEEVRSEYVEYAKEMEYLVDKLKPKIKAYIEDCGRVKTVPINKFELPPNLTKKIGTITREG